MFFMPSLWVLYDILVVGMFLTFFVLVLLRTERQKIGRQYYCYPQNKRCPYGHPFIFL